MSGRDEWDYGPFKVGDVVEGYGFVYHPERNGMSGVIAIGLQVRPTRNMITRKNFYDAVYGVEWQDGYESSIEPKNLRRRKPPMTGLEDVLAMFYQQPDRVKELA